MRILTKNAVETKKIAAKLAGELRPLKQHATVIALEGNLGAGKTTFTQGFARSLRIKENIRSPTFVLIKIYKLSAVSHTRSGFKHLIHIDCYRIDSPRDLTHLGLKDMFKDKDAVILIEWAERIQTVLPRGTIHIWFRHGRGLNTRTIEIQAKR